MMKDVYQSIYELQRRSQFREALRALLNKKSNKIKEPYSEDLNHAWYLVGQSYFELERYSDALEAFKQAVRHWNEDWHAHWAIADCYSSLGRPRMSERYLRKALTFADAGERISLKYNLGNALFDQGRYEEAIGLYRQVVRSGRGSDRTIVTMAENNIASAQRCAKE